MAPEAFLMVFLNRNETTVDLPLGGSNFIEPAEFNGMQPTRFPSRPLYWRFFQLLYRRIKVISTCGGI